MSVANKRMFSVDVVETDAFLDLQPKTQALYFHLGMTALFQAPALSCARSDAMPVT